MKVYRVTLPDRHAPNCRMEDRNGYPVTADSPVDAARILAGKLGLVGTARIDVEEPGEVHHFVVDELSAAAPPSVTLDEQRLFAALARCEDEVTELVNRGTVLVAERDEGKFFILVAYPLEHEALYFLAPPPHEDSITSEVGKAWRMDAARALAMHDGARRFAVPCETVRAFTHLAVDRRHMPFLTQQSKLAVDAAKANSTPRES